MALDGNAMSPLALNNTLASTIVVQNINPPYNDPIANEAPPTMDPAA